jgi:hypothetical protein
MTQVVFRTKEEAHAFMTPLFNEWNDLDCSDPKPSDNEHYPWMLVIPASKHQAQIIHAMTQAFRWGIELGTGRFSWSEIQQRCTCKGGDGNPVFPLGSRVRRSAYDREGHRPPPPEIGAEGKVVGYNGNAVIIQFDGVAYPREPGQALGDYLFGEDIQLI